MGWFKRLLTEQVCEAPKPAPKKRAPRRDFAVLYPRSATVVLLVRDNPKRRGTTARALYGKYGLCKTVDDCFQAGMTYRILDGDVQRGYVRIDK